METVLAKIDDIIKKKIECPLDLSVIPNHMGINLSSVEAVSWTRQNDNQLVSLTIHFIPSNDKNPILQKSIDIMGLSTRAANGLKNDGIRTIGQLVALSRVELSKIPNLGKLTQGEIIDTLASMGLLLRH